MAPDEPTQQDDRPAPASGRWSAPATRNGRLASGLALVAVVVIVALSVASNVLLENHDDDAVERDFDLVRGLFVIAFALCSVGALVNAIRAIGQNDRGAFVWIGGLIGLLGTLLMVAEFTVME